MNRVFDSIRRLGFTRGPSRLVGGIAGGIAARVTTNVWLIRLLVLVSFLLPFVGVLLYLVVWAVTPWTDGSIPLERWLASRRRPTV